MRLTSDTDNMVHSGPFQEGTTATEGAPISDRHRSAVT
jgi:hypothetical protein